MGVEETVGHLGRPAFRDVSRRLHSITRVLTFLAMNAPIEEPFIVSMIG